ncbi:MAG: helix-turn-helix transcriptional regulator [Phycisphaerales bacterium]
MARKQNTTTDAASIMNRRFGDSPERREEIEQIKHDMAIGSQIHRARTDANLTQAQLAELVGTTQSVISDLEDAEYQGHSLAMLRRVAAALHLSVRVSFVPTPGPDPTPRHAV